MCFEKFFLNQINNQIKHFLYKDKITFNTLKYLKYLVMLPVANLWKLFCYPTNNQLYLHNTKLNKDILINVKREVSVSARRGNLYSCTAE